MKIDFHVHSRHSFDSFMKIEKIIKIAKKRGLGAVAIVDHNTLMEKLNPSENFLVIPGSEIASDKGDIIGLFLSEHVKSRRAPEVIDEIRNQGGVSIIAHPYKRRSKIDEELLSKVDGIEGFNARSPALVNRLAREIASKYGLSMIAGSDAHFYFEIGRGLCVINNSVSSQEDLRKLVLRGKMKIVGSETAHYAEALSQMVRMVKTRELKVLRNVTLGVVHAISAGLKEKL